MKIIALIFLSIDKVRLITTFLFLLSPHIISHPLIDMANSSDKELDRQPSRVIECRDFEVYTKQNVIGDPRPKLGKGELRTEIYDFENMIYLIAKGDYKVIDFNKSEKTIFDYEIRNKDMYFWHPDEIYYIEEENNNFIKFRTRLDEMIEKNLMWKVLPSIWMGQGYYVDPTLGKSGTCRYIHS
tara:strand:+ start:85 stop:636 length:552 start_codon:yes stop_codon:yes gene_type:complete